MPPTSAGRSSNAALKTPLSSASDAGSDAPPCWMAKSRGKRNEMIGGWSGAVDVSNGASSDDWITSETA